MLDRGAKWRNVSTFIHFSLRREHSGIGPFRIRRHSDAYLSTRRSNDKFMVRKFLKSDDISKNSIFFHSDIVFGIVVGKME